MTEELGLSPIKNNEEWIAKVNAYGRYVPALIEKIKKDKEMQALMEEAITIDPNEISGFSLETMDKYLIAIPQILMWLQDYENVMRNQYDDACAAYEDTIVHKASSLPKTMFTTSTVSEKMRLAKIREMFPAEFDKRVAEMRTRERALHRISGQTKHIERLNDNVKKIRESMIVKLMSEKNK